jgi:RNA polymerase sigma factor (TIGR02999 family)
MNAVTQILSQIQEGHPQAAEALLPVVYEELRRLAAANLAREKPGQTLQTTALVHEAYLRLVDGNEAQGWNSRGHFFAAAAEAMRRILINAARDKKRLKRGGDRCRLDLDQVDVAASADDEQLIDLDEALEALAAADGRAADLVKLMFFGGLTLPESAALLGMAQRTAEREWAYARAWLYDRMRRGDSRPNR